MAQHRDGRQKGAQQHPEGSHGKKTRSAFQKQLHEPRGELRDNFIPTREGKHRLDEKREQHDFADRIAEINHRKG